LRKEPEKSKAKSLDYIERVNRAIDFILQNIDQPLKLEFVAKTACFSPFHFHRIFRSLTGESLNGFIKRVRLERALTLMSRVGGARGRKASLTEIAFACGFGSSSDFSRCFNQRYGVPASRFDVESFRMKQREEWQVAVSDPKHRNLLQKLKAGTNPDGFEVRVRVLPPRTVAYIRVQNSFRPGAVPLAAEQLMQWAQGRRLAHGQWLGYMWDDPEIVAHRNCRYDVGVEVTNVTRDRQVGLINFPPMQVGEVEIRGGIDLEMRALDWLFGTWLPQSGRMPADQPIFEAWIGHPFAHGTEYFELALQLPLERA
jgi:AraC family transcriptional regulator